VTTVAILAESEHGETKYRAIAGMQQSVGNTPGQALDAIAATLPQGDAGTLVVVQQFRPDSFFSEAERHRLEFLMSRWRIVRDRGSTFLESEHRELESLIDAEIRAATARAAAVIQETRD